MKNKLVIILVALVIIMGSYIVYDNFISNDGNQENQNYISKLDDNKAWIYDADYEYNVSEESYFTGYSTHNVKDIVVPYINIDSRDAKKVNIEINNVFNDAINTYNKGLNDKMTYVDCSYEEYGTDYMASVVISYGVGGTDIVRPNYYAYNFNLEDGNLLSYEETYKIVGLTSENIESKVKQAISDFIKQYHSIGFGYDIDSYIDKTINNYTTAVNNNDMEYFVDNDNNLNIIVDASTFWGQFERIITIK